MHEFPILLRSRIHVLPLPLTRDVTLILIPNSEEKQGKEFPDFSLLKRRIRESTILIHDSKCFSWHMLPDQEVNSIAQPKMQQRFQPSFETCLNFRFLNFCI